MSRVKGVFGDTGWLVIFLLLIFGAVGSVIAVQQEWLTSEQIAKYGMWAIIALIALYLAIVSPKLIVFLLLTGYAGVTQFAPGVILGTSWKRITKNGVLAGLIAGILTVIVTRIIYTDPFGVFGGFWGLMVNTLVTIIVSIIEGKK